MHHLQQFCNHMPGATVTARSALSRLPLLTHPPQVASLWCLLTKGVHVAQGPTCKKPLVLCPSSLVQNWGKVRHRAWLWP
jgi:hypothetical protein